MKKKKTHSNEIMKPHFKFIYTRKLFLNCKLLTMSSLQIIKTLTETIFHSKQSLALGVYIKSFRQSQIMIQFAICRVIRVKTVLLVIIITVKTMPLEVRWQFQYILIIIGILDLFKARKTTSKKWRTLSRKELFLWCKRMNRTPIIIYLGQVHVLKFSRKTLPMTYGKGSKIVRGCHFDRTRKLLSFKLLDKKRSIISVAYIIYISPILQCLHGAFNLTVTTHLDVLSVLDEMEV